MLKVETFTFSPPQVVYKHVYTREQPYDCTVGFEAGWGFFGGKFFGTGIEEN